MATKQPAPAPGAKSQKKLYQQIGMLVVILSIIMYLMISQNSGGVTTTSTLPPVDEIKRTGGKFFSENGLREAVERANYEPPQPDAAGSNPFDNLR